MNDLTITISGAQASGKTTIATIVAEFLLARLSATAHVSITDEGEQRFLTPPSYARLPIISIVTEPSK